TLDVCSGFRGQSSTPRKGGDFRPTCRQSGAAPNDPRARRSRTTRSHHRQRRAPRSLVWVVALRVSTPGRTRGQQPASMRTEPGRRQVDASRLENLGVLKRLTGLDGGWLATGIDNAYFTLDVIDRELALKQVPPMAQLVELANLSSMLGNLLGAGLAE